MKIIIITGTPGTGKTVLAKKLVKYLPAKLLAVKQIIKKHNLEESYDQSRDTYVIDIIKLNKILIQYITKIKKDNNNVPSFLLIESHLSHYLPRSHIDLCIITNCNLKVLQIRLKKREYSKKKVRENLDAEIFEIIYHESKQSKHNLLKVDTSKGITLNTLNKIKNHIKG